MQKGVRKNERAANAATHKARQTAAKSGRRWGLGTTFFRMPRRRCKRRHVKLQAASGEIVGVGIDKAPALQHQTANAKTANGPYAPICALASAPSIYRLTQRLLCGVVCCCLALFERREATRPAAQNPATSSPPSILQVILPSLHSLGFFAPLVVIPDAMRHASCLASLLLASPIRLLLRQCAAPEPTQRASG